MLAAQAIPEVSWQFLLGVVVLTTTMIAMTRRRLMRQSLNPRAEARQRAAENRQRNGAEGEVRDLLLELEKAGREITAQLDTRYRKLELVLRDADRRIAELRRLAGAASPAGDTPPSGRLDLMVGDDDADHAALSASVPVASAASADFDRVYALADRNLSPADIARRVQRTQGEVELMLAMRAGRAKAMPPEPASRAR